MWVDSYSRPAAVRRGKEKLRSSRAAYAARDVASTVCVGESGKFEIVMITATVIYSAALNIHN